MTNKSIYLLSSSGNYAKLEIEDLSLAETNFSVADIEDITKRKDTFTTNIVVKGTKLNNQILGSAFNMNAYNNPNINEELYFNFNINGQCDCLYYENDSLITKGLFKVTEVIVNGGTATYNCVITGYRVNFYSKLNDKLLSDLDFSEYNHSYSINNIVSSWDTSIIKNGSSVPFEYGKGYVYGFADYGTSIYPDKRTVDDVSFKDFRPSFYVKEYLDKIFAQDVLDGFSYSIKGSSEFQDMFKHLVIPNNADVVANYLNSQRLLSATKNNEQTYLTGDRQYVYDDVSNSNLYKIGIQWTNVSLNNGVFNLNTQPYIDYSNNVFIATRSVSTSVEVSSGIRFETFFPRNGNSDDIIDATCTLHIVTRPNDNSGWSKIASSDPKRIHTDGEHWSTGVYTFKAKTNISVTNGAQMMVVYEFTDYYKDWGGPIPLQDWFLSAILVGQNTFINIGDSAFTSKVELELNDSINFESSQSLATYKQQDFIKSIQNLFNLYVYNDVENPKHIYFEPYNDFYTECLTPNIKNSSVNWSNKLDYKQYNKKPFQTIYKNYKFQYKEDGDYLNGIIKNKYGAVYGNYTYTNSTTAFTADNTIELIFASTPMMTWAESTRVLPLFFNYDSSGNKVPKQTVIRILYYNGLKPCSNYNIGRWKNDGGWGFDVYAAGKTSYPQLHTTYDVTKADLNFNKPDEVFYTYTDEPNYIYPIYYRNQITEYNDSNTVTIDAKVLLNEIDISNLSFKKSIYFDTPTGDGFFKLLSVNYGDNSTLSDVTFQKIYLADNYALITYYNVEITGYVSNPNCSGVSESVYINVPGGKYSSTISQENADAQAKAEYDHTKDAVEDTGVCINTDNVFHLTFSQTNLQSCTIVPDEGNYFTSTGTLEMGTVLFKQVGSNYVRCSLGYYSNNTNWFLANQNGEVNVTGSCADVGLNEITMAKAGGSIAACQNANNGFNLSQYFYRTYLFVGEKIFTESTGTNTASAGYYSDAYYSYQVDATGTITNQYYC